MRPAGYSTRRRVALGPVVPDMIQAGRFGLAGAGCSPVSSWCHHSGPEGWDATKVTPYVVKHTDGSRHRNAEPLRKQTIGGLPERRLQSFEASIPAACRRAGYQQSRECAPDSQMRSAIVSFTDKLI